MTDTDPDRAVLVVHAHGNDRALETGIGHSRHCQKQLAGQETRVVHLRDIGPQKCTLQERFDRLEPWPVAAVGTSGRLPPEGDSK